MLPMVQTRGITENALGCNSFWGTNSATAVLITPTFPFTEPDKPRATIAHARDRERPKNRLASIVQSKPTRITGFRPNRSEARPQKRPVSAWLKEKTADVIPAHLATLFFGTSKLSIISGCVKSVLVRPTPTIRLRTYKVGEYRCESN